ncbi:MAG: hypothetical protein M3P51_12105 [Chloroflexota bacterium]|nr:hypothetical protein [Chloroflexota bacterium]
MIGTEDEAQHAVAVAAEQVVAVERDGKQLHPPVRRDAPRLRPAQRRAVLARQARRRHTLRHLPIDGATPTGASSPARVLLEEATRHNQAVAVNAQGVLTTAPNDAPPGFRLHLPVAAVRDLEGLLAAGYQVSQSPRGDTVSVWPSHDAPDIRWLEAGTPQERPDLRHEQRRLERRGLIAHVPGATAPTRSPARTTTNRRRHITSRRRTRP